MASAQVAFLADDKLEVLGYEIDTVGQLNLLRTAINARIDFDDDWTTLGPPNFGGGWPPTKAESSQAAQ